jgi:Dam-replacing HTH domain
MYVVNTNWDDSLLQQISESRKSVRIATPSLSQHDVKQILGAMRRDTNLEIATGFGIKEFYHGSTDLDAVESMIRGNGQIIGVPGLEAMFAVFDEERAFLSSGYLVSEGPASHKSYNVLIDNVYVSKQISTDFNQLIGTEPALAFSLRVVQDYREIVRQLRNNEKGIGNDKVSVAKSPTELLDSLDLKGWTLDVLEVVMRIKAQTFRLSEVYDYVQKLQASHPLNNNIEAKIRQQLQVLRDLQLLEFVDQRGTYRKRWPLVK